MQTLSNFVPEEMLIERQWILCSFAVTKCVGTRKSLSHISRRNQYNKDKKKSTQSTYKANSVKLFLNVIQR